MMLANFKHLTSNLPEEMEIGRKCRCPTCGKEFESKKYLAEHMKIHTGVKKACTCRKCGKSFTPKTKRAVAPAKEKIYHMNREHMKIHTGVKKACTCRKCGKSFTPKTKRAVAPAKEKNYPCSKCGKQFVLLTALNEHVFKAHVNPGVKGRQCKKCGKHFHGNKKVSCEREGSKLEEKKVETLQCWVCGEEPGFKSSLVDQFKPQDMGFRYTCPKCDECLESGNNLGACFGTFSDMLALVDDREL